jgi:hypothetical protein
LIGLPLELTIAGLLFISTDDTKTEVALTSNPMRKSSWGKLNFFEDSLGLIGEKI